LPNPAFSSFQPMDMAFIRIGMGLVYTDLPIDMQPNEKSVKLFDDCLFSNHGSAY